ncbi:hypothetical protein CCYN49044_30025 [Capnocytophaga cynodegmi]|nr:hypothetical protein CCYN49044_30025 [Capnocytophaga cynodegmi]
MLVHFTLFKNDLRFDSDQFDVVFVSLSEVEDIILMKIFQKIISA